MSPSAPQTCTHDRGRGTTVCLRCRHEHAQAAQRRRQKFLMQFLGLASVVAIVGVAGVGAASTLRGDDDAPATTTSEGSVSAPERPAAEKNQATGTVPPVVQQQAAAPVAAPPSVVVPPEPAAPTPRAATRGGFVVTEGRTQLTDSIYAIRAGDSVIVSFDAYGYRTGRWDKIENTLRITLPLVFGRTPTASLDTLEKGELLLDRDVVGTLASRGTTLELDNGAVVRIRTLTRPTSDGVLATGYLATIER